MKGYVTFVLVAIMSLGLIFLIATRSRTIHDAPAQVVEVVVADGGDGGAAEAGDASASGAAVEAAAPKPADHPLRVTTLGWELVAPGVALTAVDGGALGPALELAPEGTLEALEARLARGGSDPVGADIAILPLPAFVMAWEHVRALEPRAFMVVGFSCGREEVHARPGALLKPPPGADEVRLVGLGPPTAADPTMRATGSESATFLGLFALDALGVAPARVRLVAPHTPSSADARGEIFAAIVRGADDERKLALSTADASRLVPIVAIAPKTQLDEQAPKMRDFARAWFEGIDRAGKDAANVARRLANKEALPFAAGVGGAPEAIVLLDRLGQLAPANLAQQRALMGPEAKGPVTLETLAQRTWTLARAGGLTASPAPLPLPIDARTIAAIAPPPPIAPPRASVDSPAVADGFAPLPGGATPLVLYRVVDPRADAAFVAEQIGFFAGVFERGAFRVSAKGGEKAARAIAIAAHERFDVPIARLATVSAEPLSSVFATVEIFALP